MSLQKYLFCCLLIFMLVPLKSQTTAMSFNIRYDTKNDGENWWGNRQGEVVQLLNYYTPDFLGIQEGLHHQVEFIDSSLVQYAYIGVGRDDGKQKGEYTPIFYDSTQFELLESNTFWLSNTPTKVSVGWDASMERICTYGVFKHKKSDVPIYVFNAHFDHIGQEARKRSAQLMLDKIQELHLDQQRIMVMGDFNCLPEEVPILVFKKLLDDGMEISKKEPYGPIGTFNSFDPQLVIERRIDYVFTKNVNVISYRHIAYRRANNLCVSDHLPVMIEIEN